jgi:hypothetical protein
LYGCASVATPLPGWIYTGVKGPIDAENAFEATKKGEACAVSILGLIASGDASIVAAKADGKIREVATVDHKSTSVLGIYASFCTIVTGR